MQATLFSVEEEARGVDDADEWSGLTPAMRLQFEADESVRLARLAEERLAVEGVEGGTCIVTARFPLVDDAYELRVHPRSLAAVEHGANPRKLGELLLRAVRTAQDEGEAMSSCEALILPTR